MGGSSPVCREANDPDALVGLPETQVRLLIDKLRTSGARAVISRNRPAFANDSGWVCVPKFGLYVRLL
jgi:hypothetical protein